MIDIQFVSELLIFLREGIKSSVSQTAINDMYDRYNSNYSFYEQDYELILNILKQFDSYFMYDKSNISILSKTTHLYTLFVLFYDLNIRNIPLESIRKQIKMFFDQYNMDENSIDARVKEYKNIIRIDSSKSPNARYKRYKLLSSFVLNE